MTQINKVFYGKALLFYKRKQGDEVLSGIFKNKAFILACLLIFNFSIPISIKNHIDEKLKMQPYIKIFKTKRCGHE